MHIPPPQPGEYKPYTLAYISKVPDGQVAGMLADNLGIAQQMIATLSDEQLLHAYAPGKWTVREVLLHILDCERVYAYRALRLGRGDATELPGFDENLYAPASGANSRSRQSLLDEYASVRAATLTLLQSLPAGAYTNSAIINGHTTSLRAVAYMMAGHEQHHLDILRERYL